jgi:hypothetical protein
MDGNGIPGASVAFVVPDGTPEYGYVVSIPGVVHRLVVPLDDV